MGVKVNHVLKKKADRPTVLTTGSLININNTSFVFINPTNSKPPPVHNEPQSESEANTPAEEITLDNQLEGVLVELLEKKESMTTQAIISALNENRAKDIDKVRCHGNGTHVVNNIRTIGYFITCAGDE
jgi:ABC-type methionine transport system ATPase subunit